MGWTIQDRLFTQLVCWLLNKCSAETVRQNAQILSFLWLSFLTAQQLYSERKYSQLFPVVREEKLPVVTLENNGKREESHFCHVLVKAQSLHRFKEWGNKLPHLKCNDKVLGAIIIQLDVRSCFNTSDTKENKDNPCLHELIVQLVT